jgi:hypothetical protein
MQKLRGELHTANGGTTKPILSRTSTGAVNSELRLENNPNEIRPPVAVSTTLGESGGVSIRIELDGRVAVNEHWTIAELLAILAARK